MASLTPQRVKLSMKQRAKIIKGSKKTRLDKNKIITEYGISRKSSLGLLKNKSLEIEIISENVGSSSMNEKSKKG